MSLQASEGERSILLSVYIFLWTRLLLSVAIHTDRSDKLLSLKLSSNTRYVSDSLLPPLATLMCDAFTAAGTPQKNFHPSERERLTPNGMS